MRFWWASALIVVAPAGLAQDAPPVAASTGTVTAALPHTACGGDDVATKTPQLLDGYGNGGFKVTTDVPAAQAFFDNGMALAAAFAHRAAIAAFREAARRDPTCAMCLWGEAWASGPTINYDIERADMDKLAAEVAKAEPLAAKAGTDRERALIAALKLRYAPGKTVADNFAYAKAMDALAVAYPQDNAIATLAADSQLMAAKGEPDEAKKFVHVYRSIALLEAALQRDPNYTPAIHFYIHASEIGKVPARAEPYADRLAMLAPKASHLVHMPSHTYYWVGRYEDAAQANLRAVAIGIDNAKSLGMPAPDGVWDLPYHAHNVHFGVGGAMMAGDARIALALSDPLVARAGKRDKGSVYAQMVAGMGYFAEGRIADPAAVLALPEPKLAYAKAYWHYARGEAQARLGHADAVRVEAAAIPATIDAKDGKDKDSIAVAAAGNRLAAISKEVLAGRAAMLDSEPAVAEKAFRRAAALQDDKGFADFSDPPLWWYPVRRSVAEALLVENKPDAALAEADASLKTHPNDPMTLAVRARAQAALGHAEAARQDRVAALRGWRGDRKDFAPAQI